jgi:hypothetical protein
MSTIFWDIMPCSLLKVNRRFGGTYRLHLQDWINRARYQRESRLQASRLTRTTRRHIPEDSTLDIVPRWRYLLGLQTKPLNLPHSLFPTSLVGSTIALLQTNSSLTNCVDHSLFPSTLLTVDYSLWRPTIHRRLSALVASSLANYSLGSRWRTLQTNWLQTDSRLKASGSLPDCKLTLHSEILVLKSARANGIVDTYRNCSYMRWNGLVTGETSVVHSQCIAVGLFSE